MASERPLRPKQLPFPPPACSPYELMPHNASLNDPEAGLELHQLREGPSSGLHGNSKSDAVLDSWLIICVLFTTNCCKKAMNVLGRNWSQTAKLRSTSCCTVNIVLYGGTVLYGRTPSFQTDRTCTVLYGVLRYGTVITVKNAEVQRISTSLSKNGACLLCGYCKDTPYTCMLTRT